MTDLTPWLREWPWRPGNLDVRVVSGSDGRPLFQVRLELGLLQMEADGRPDGLGYRDAPSALAWFVAHPEVRIDGGAVQDLEAEMAQRRQRGVACAAIQDWARARRDASDNVQALDLVAARAEHAADRGRLEGWRVHELALRARAEASLAVSMGRRDLARQALEAGLAAVRQACVAGQAGQTPQIAMLMGLLDALTLKLPSSERAELERRLQAAVRAENFELAAILRDELRLLGGSP
jgi:hypothetical protein